MFILISKIAWAGLFDFHTLCGTVMFISWGPRELNAPLCLVRQLQVSWWVRFFCKHNRQTAENEKWPMLIFSFFFFFLLHWLLLQNSNVYGLCINVGLYILAT